MAELRPVDELTDEEFQAELAKLESIPKDEEITVASDASEEDNEDTDEEEDSSEETSDSTEEDEVEQPDDEEESESDDTADEDEDTQESEEESEEPTEEDSEDTESAKTDETPGFDFSSIPMDEVIPMEIPANGMKVKATMNELVEGFKKGMNYTQKMQALSQHGKDMGIMKDNGLTTNDLNLLVEAKQGNKEALAKLMSDAKVDPLDLEAAKEAYTPQDYGKAPVDLDMEQVKETILADTEYSSHVEKAIKDMPDDMYELVSSSSGNLNALYQDVRSGLYAEVMPEVMKLQSLYGKTAPTMETYLKVAEARAKKQTEAPQQKAVNEVKETKRKVNRKKAANASKPNKVKEAVIDDVNSLDSDEFAKAFAKMTGRSLSEY